MAVPGLMSYDEWWQKASAGHPEWDPNDPENRAQYNQYVYTAEGMQGGAMGGDNTDYGKSGGTNSQRQYRGGQDEDYARFSDAQLKSWESQKDSNCPPNAPYQAFDGSGCVQKPIESANPAKWGGTNGRSGGGGGGGRGGGGGGYGGGGGGGDEYGGYDGSFDNPIFSYLRDEYMADVEDPDRAVNKFMGYGGAGQYQSQLDQMQQQLDAMPPGPAKDAAMARLAEQRNVGLSSMRASAMSQANDRLNSLVSPEYQYAGLGENARQANMSDRLGWGNLNENARQADMANQLGWGNLNLNRDQFGYAQNMGWAQFGEGQRQFDQTLGFNRWNSEGNWGNQQNQLNQQLTANQPTGWQKGLNTAGSVLSMGRGVLDMWNQWKNRGQG
jgi:hypothetical protein